MIQVRQAIQNDLPFVLASWFESYWKRTARHQCHNYASYQKNYGRLLERIAATAQIPIVHFDSVPDEILGYAVHHGNTLHYVYVKKDFRRQGLALTLLQHIQPRIHTHETDLFRKHFAHRYGSTVDSYLLHSYCTPNLPPTERPAP